MNRDVFNPRFSVRNASQSGVYDVADGKFATNAAKKAQASANVQNSRIAVQARAPTVVYPGAPSPQDRLHWMSQNRVDTPMDVVFVDDNGGEEHSETIIVNFKDQEQVEQEEQVVERARWQVAPPAILPVIKRVPEEPTDDDRQYWQSDAVVAEPSRYTDFQKFGEREGNLQRDIRRRKNLDVIRAKGRAFEFQGPVHFQDAPAKNIVVDIDPNSRHRQYWGGHTVVQASNTGYKAPRFASKNDE